MEQTASVTGSSVTGSYWLNKEEKESFKLIKTDGSTLTLKKGDWISLPERTDKCIIDKVYSYSNSEIGPDGISYLPWRDQENRFATVLFSLKGNGRFVQCFPVGLHAYGMYIEWNKLYLCDAPQNVTAEQIAKVLDR